MKKKEEKERGKEYSSCLAPFSIVICIPGFSVLQRYSRSKRVLNLANVRTGSSWAICRGDSPNISDIIGEPQNDVDAEVYTLYMLWQVVRDCQSRFAPNTGNGDRHGKWLALCIYIQAACHYIYPFHFSAAKKKDAGSDNIHFFYSSIETAGLKKEDPSEMARWPEVESTPLPICWLLSEAHLIPFNFPLRKSQQGDLRFQ